MITSFPSHLQILLEKGLNAFGLQLEIDPFIHYLTLLNQWNKAYNLTAIKDPEKMITHHLLDSLAIIPQISGSHILDVGTGAGFPGLPLALANPNWELTLLDSNGKKVAFLKEAQRRLGITNIRPVQSRVETFKSPSLFDTITSRALSNLQQFVTQSHHLIKPEGIWLAMKGQVPSEETSTLPYRYTVKQYDVPYLAEQRCCVLIHPN